MKKLILLLTVSTQVIVSCPVNVTNDSTSPIIVVDPYGTQALYLEPDQAQVINPSLAPLWYYFPLKYFKKETLAVYTQKDNGLYVLSYILKENYCAPGTEELSFSTIKDLVDHPTDRYYVTHVEDDHAEDAHEH